MPKGTITGKAIVAHTPDGDLLVGAVEGACPLCGPFELLIPGHHMKALRDLLIEWCDTFPDLTGTTVTRIDDYSFRSRGPTDPAAN